MVCTLQVMCAYMYIQTLVIMLFAALTKCFDTNGFHLFVASTNPTLSKHLLEYIHAVNLSTIHLFRLCKYLLI